MYHEVYEEEVQEFMTVARAASVRVMVARPSPCCTFSFMLSLMLSTRRAYCCKASILSLALARYSASCSARSMAPALRFGTPLKAAGRRSRAAGAGACGWLAARLLPEDCMTVTGNASGLCLLAGGVGSAAARTNSSQFYSMFTTKNNFCTTPTPSRTSAQNVGEFHLVPPRV
jgi:hypothetical protein